MNVHDVFIASELAKENGGVSGGGLTQAEVEKIVTDEVAKIVADAPEDFDTLKEMSDWISQHEESAAAMNSAIESNTSAIQTNASAIADNTSAIDTNKTNILTLKKHVAGELTDEDFQEDSTVAMTKTVPTGMSDYAGIKVIGGYTRKTVNLINVPDTTISSSGGWCIPDKTTLVLEHGTYTVSYDITSSDSNIGHSFVFGQADDANKTSFSIYGTGHKSETFIILSGGTTLARSYVGGEATVSNFQIQKGTTATSYEPYGQLWNAATESVVSVGRNLFDGKTVATGYYDDTGTWIARSNILSNKNAIRVKPNTTYYAYMGSDTVNGMFITEWNGDKFIKRTHLADGIAWTFTTTENCNKINFNLLSNYGLVYKRDITISEGTSREFIPYHESTLLLPDSDRNLHCFGYGIDETVQNVRDYENGTYTQMVAEVDLGDCDYTYYSATGVFFTDSVTKKANGMSNLICGSLDAATSGDKIIYGNTSSARVHIKDTTKGTTDATAFKEAMKGVKLVYELATPVVTDCSDILHPIRVETGGTITFQNEHGLDVPNTIVYKKEVSTI